MFFLFTPQGLFLRVSSFHWIQPYFQPYFRPCSIILCNMDCPLQSYVGCFQISLRTMTVRRWKRDAIVPLNLKSKISREFGACIYHGYSENTSLRRGEYLPSENTSLRRSSHDFLCISVFNHVLSSRYFNTRDDYVIYYPFLKFKVDV